MKYSKLKEELKSLAIHIRINKFYYRELQSKISLEKLDWPQDREEFQRLWYLQNKIYADKKNFRHKHIAYSLLKGKKYEEIERFVKEDNKPDWKLIGDIKNEYS